MPTTFQKRQKEMKRMEKQRMKAERRAQRKIARNAETGASEQAEGSQQDVEETDGEMGSPILPGSQLERD